MGAEGAVAAAEFGDGVRRAVRRSVPVALLGSKDPVDQKPADDSRSDALTAPSVVRQVWRVRLWVRVVAVVLPLAVLPFVVQPQLPVGELIAVAFFYAAFGFVACPPGP